VRILIVDDSKAMRMIVMRHLRQAGYGDSEMVEAANGAEALDKVRSSDFDLVLSDWNMPEVNGYEFLVALRAEGETVHFGFVTSESTAEMRHLAAEAGAQFLIAKPFTVEAFTEAMSTVAA
jgi:two-component system chemotaxis response regulator CheY